MITLVHFSTHDQRICNDWHDVFRQFIAKSSLKYTSARMTNAFVMDTWYSNHVRMFTGHFGTIQRIAYTLTHVEVGVNKKQSCWHTGAHRFKKAAVHQNIPCCGWLVPRLSHNVSSSPKQTQSHVFCHDKVWGFYKVMWFCGMLLFSPRHECLGRASFLYPPLSPGPGGLWVSQTSCPLFRPPRTRQPTGRRPTQKAESRLVVYCRGAKIL